MRNEPEAVGCGFGVEVTVGLEGLVALFVDPEELRRSSFSGLGGGVRAFVGALSVFFGAAFGAEVQESRQRGAELAFEAGFVAVEEFEGAGVVGQGAEGDEGLGLGVFAFDVAGAAHFAVSPAVSRVQTRC